MVFNGTGRLLGLSGLVSQGVGVSGVFSEFAKTATLWKSDGVVVSNLLPAQAGKVSAFQSWILVTAAALLFVAGCVTIFCIRKRKKGIKLEDSTRNEMDGADEILSVDTCDEALYEYWSPIKSDRGEDQETLAGVTLTTLTTLDGQDGKPLATTLPDERDVTLPSDEASTASGETNRTILTGWGDGLEN
jgi:hypothetical protein